MNATTNKTDNYTMEVYPPESQGSGAFDGGKITEIKPIPFPHERGGAQRTGPLFYWAWASAKGDGVIGMHPHQGFEIISYVIEGAIGHTDTAGNNRRVSAGGIQAMQTGNGISHQEEMYGERTEFFQVWFEPNMQLALRQTPTYCDFEDSEFNVTELNEHARLKRIVGAEGSLKLGAPIEWNEVQLDSAGNYAFKLEANSLAAMVVISGSASLRIDTETTPLKKRDFTLIKTNGSQDINIDSTADDTRISLITAPLDPGYPLLKL